MEKEHLIFGIRAIIEAIQSGKEIDKVFVQKEISGELMKDLMKAMRLLAKSCIHKNLLRNLLLKCNPAFMAIRKRKWSDCR
jgi:tRNA G18 (ribose-2'-O)-methylase SpoU